MSLNAGSVTDYSEHFINREAYSYMYFPRATDSGISVSLVKKRSDTNFTCKVGWLTCCFTALDCRFIFASVTDHIRWSKVTHNKWVLTTPYSFRDLYTEQGPGTVAKWLAHKTLKYMTRSQHKCYLKGKMWCHLYPRNTSVHCQLQFSNFRQKLIHCTVYVSSFFSNRWHPCQLKEIYIKLP